MYLWIILNIQVLNVEIFYWIITKSNRIMIEKSLYTLLKNVSTNIPTDILNALICASSGEETLRAKTCLDIILSNISISKSKLSPLCQDTGYPCFWVTLPKSVDLNFIKGDIKNAIIQATKDGLLRPNAVDPLTWKNSWNNIWEWFPKIYFEYSNNDTITVDVLLKWWGSENMSSQISLPAEIDWLKVWRNIEWIQAAILHVVKSAQWKWCAPGILWVHIWWDRTVWYEQSKKNLLRHIWNLNSDPLLAKLEADIIVKANETWIWAMWLWGKTTLLDCIISSSHRLPASYFVTVSYLCWAARRWQVEIDLNDNIVESDFNKNDFQFDLNIDLSKVKKLKFPLDKQKVRSLNVWDIVSFSWVMYTWRDMIHEYSKTNKLLKNISMSAIYHCWPVAIKDKNWNWEFKACWPTTSIREEPYEYDFIKKTWISAVIWKWWMWQDTLNALSEFWAVYLNAIWWAASYYANSIVKVVWVDYLEFWIPEAVWEIEVKDFLCIVSMDSHGSSLHK